jgi:hypothetical protein
LRVIAPCSILVGEAGGSSTKGGELRAGVFIILALAVWAIGGCAISRHIEPIEPPPQPPLTELEDHLSYVDPDSGRADYVVEPGEGYAAQNPSGGRGR